MNRKEELVWNIGVAGQISYEEEQLARSVFRDQLPYGRIWLANRYIWSNTPVTVANSDDHYQADYVIYWGDPNVYANGADHGDQTRATFIHELTHVWQGHHGYSPKGFMVESILAQGGGGVADIVKQRRYSDWNIHRSKAYIYSMKDIGKPWISFNVEQQGNIVQDWFRRDDYQNADGEIIKGGAMSPDDPRYPYIVYNIRAGKSLEDYIPIGQPGYSAKIALYQEKLFALGYLTDRKYVDGFMNDATRVAVRAFQTRNGLPPDGDIGGPNSRTRAKLKQNPATLRRAQP